MGPQPRRGPRERGGGRGRAQRGRQRAYRQLQGARRNEAQHTALTRKPESWRPGRGRRLVRCSHQLHPLDATQQQPRADGALLQRVRLGYCTREELQEDFEGQVCDHCEMQPPRPLVHYLLSCPPPPP
ncbi:hypothetical protein GWK47_005784 [Chionoecetes opilio]|uniref:Uncharacterized protein n=1 Tax=Chionoecetes opilio TaxID=41210 RepID=A0A8J5CJ86_CHIOP|nr:hypothetical protein GWK47_005784 [Chionoecetes opilio]